MIRVGIPWLGHTCGTCAFCHSGRENLCDSASFTGYQIDGGFATHCIADADYCFRNSRQLRRRPRRTITLRWANRLPIPEGNAGDAEHLGIYGFGAAAHIVAQIANHQGRKVFAFTRRGDKAAQEFALQKAAFGPAALMKDHQNNLKQRLFSHQWETSFREPSTQRKKAERLSLAVST